jgi:hypothetical protein
MPNNRVPQPPLEYGDGDHLPLVDYGFPNKLIKAMVGSLKSAGLKPHHVKWLRRLVEWDSGVAPEGLPFGDYWKIGNRVYDGTFGYFEFWPETNRPVLYKTSNRWTRLLSSDRHDGVEKLSRAEAMTVAKNYYTGLREELLLVEDKVKSRFGSFGRSYYTWNPRTHLTEEFWDNNER